MLERLFIKNFATIEDLDVEFNNGFLALSGETGAGKTIIISALSLLSGEKSSYDKIRHGAQKAFIEGSFRIENKEVLDEIKSLIDDEIEDNLLIITRSLDISNKTVVKVNSKTVTLSILKRISGLIFDIHSQQKDADYLKEDKQLNLLDLFISKLSSDDEKKVYDDYQNVYKEYLDILVKIDDLNSNKDNLGELDVLEYQYNELSKADIKEHEMEYLEEEKIKLSSFMKITDRIQAFLNEYSQATAYLYQAKKQLSYINEDEFEFLNEKFNDSYYQLEDTYQTIQDIFENYAEKLNKFEQIQERLYLLHSLRKKYGYSTEDILNRFEEISKAIDEIKNFDTYLTKLNNQKEAVLKRLNELAIKLTKIRKTHAKTLENHVNMQLKELYLENAEFKIEFSYLDKFNSKGIDHILFLLKANAGGAFLSLSKSASLGETSRLNLALKTVFNDLNPKETIVFDEIDIGISGRVGTAISKKISLISNKSQVIVISHLPQVCAGAKYHYFVSKEVKNNQTYSSIKLLSREERIEEIAKMMVGLEDSSTTRTVAEELLTSFNN